MIKKEIKYKYFISERIYGKANNTIEFLSQKYPRSYITTKGIVKETLKIN